MEALANSTKDPLLQAKAWYNKGVAEAKQQQMEQALASFKKSLLLDNTNEAARENMQMILNELNKKKGPNPNQHQPNKNQPAPQPTKQPSKKQAEQQLNMLREEEKRLQKEIQQKKYNPNGANERDW
jgi:Ca-activated chloride channel family protein